MNVRVNTIIIGLLDAAATAAIAVNCYYSTSDNATIGFDYAAGVIVTALFALTGLPGLALAATKRTPRTALGLALAFPAMFVLLFVAVVIAFASP
jgi:hypothetical protein